jgi:hypothetical protein
MRRSLVLGVVLLAGCPLPTPTPAPSARPSLPVGVRAPPPEPREDGRLPALATPTAYTLELRIDPAQPRFSGRARIAVDIPARTSFVVLHGRGLTITAARAEAGGPNSTSIPARASVRAARGAREPA